MTDKTIEDVQDLLSNRAATYALLVRMLEREPSVSFLRGLVDDLIGSEDPDEVGEGYPLLRQFALDVQRADLAQVTAELGVEYSRLFFTGRKDSVHPFESVYTSEEGLMMQQARDEVLAAYRKQGLAKTEAFNEPEDHLAVELEFMASLCQRMAVALTDGQRDTALALLDDQEAFLKQHLLVWAPRFCHDLEQATRSDFYRGVALLTQEHLAQESATVAEIAAALGLEQPKSGAEGSES